MQCIFCQGFGIAIRQMHDSARFLKMSRKRCFKHKIHSSLTLAQSCDQFQQAIDCYRQATIAKKFKG